ncbi:MAG: growth inhibitor PemK [Steroidobacteraceae bacterium]
MAGFPEPEVGLVISYSYLWKEEEERGLVEGRKDRPCAIVLAVDVPAPDPGGRKQVAVAPITHSPPHDLNVAVEIPPRVKEHLGLDGERSWVVLEEVNIFTWPGFDLRPFRRDDTRIDYGMLPPKFFDGLIEKFKELRPQGKVAGASRDEPAPAAKA